MADHVCHWRHAYLFDNVFRRLLYDPRKLFAPYVSPDMTVMDVGCGMGYNAIGMARIVGDGGSVIAVDLQQEMLDVLMKRASRAGVSDRIRTHRCEPDSIGVDDAVDFIVVFWVVHEVPDAAALFGQMVSCLRPDAKLFVAEPRFHVSADDFGRMIGIAEQAGLKVHDRPRVRWSRAAVFARA